MIELPNVKNKNVMKQMLEIFDQNVLMESNGMKVISMSLIDQEEIKELQSKLGKDIFSYVDIKKYYIKEKDYYKMIERQKEWQRRQEEIEKQEQERIKKQLEKERILKEKNEKLIKELNIEEKDIIRVESNVGIYDEEVKIIATWVWKEIIKDQYKVDDWKGNIKISEEAYVKCLKDNLFDSIKKFKNKKGYRAEIIGYYNEVNNNGGIYGLYEGEELVYIGYTSRAFEIREYEHRENVKKRSSSLSLYKDLKEDFTMKPLLSFKDLKIEGNLSTREAEAMELAFITYFQPKYNISGRVINYKWN